MLPNITGYIPLIDVTQTNVCAGAGTVQLVGEGPLFDNFSQWITLSEGRRPNKHLSFCRNNSYSE